MRRLTSDLFETSECVTTLGHVAAAPDTTGAFQVPSDEELREQRQRVFEQAHEQGFSSGIKGAENEIDRRVVQIEAQLREEHAAILKQLLDKEERLKDLLASVPDSLEVYARSSESLAIEVAIAAVVRLLGGKLVDRSLMTDLCRAIVKDYGHPSAVLRVSEMDLPLLKIAEIDIPIEADRRLSPGQCVIETARGQFESGLDVRLDALCKALMASLIEYREMS